MVNPIRCANNIYPFQRSQNLTPYEKLQREAHEKLVKGIAWIDNPQAKTEGTNTNLNRKTIDQQTTFMGSSCIDNLRI